MVRRVCTSEDVKHNSLSRQLYSSSRRMATMGRQRFGHWRSVDYVFVLILFLQCFSAPIPCNFSASCNQTFYWMLINTTDQTLDEQNVKAWLNNLNCPENYASYNITSTSGNPSSLVVDTNVSCATSNDSKTCEVILQLRGPADVCCIRQTVMTASNSSNVTVVGDIVRVGVCFNSTTSSLQHQICNQLESQKKCTLSPPPTTSKPPCNCLSNCNSSEAYYHVTLENVSMNATDLKSYLNNFFETAPCRNTSDCKDFVQMYLDLTVAGCSGGICTVIVKLRDSINVCNIMLAIEAIITQQNVSINISDVTRVAMCSWSNDNPIGQNITLVKSSASFSGFCNNNTLTSLINCSVESSVVFLLNDRCYANQTITFLNSTTTPPSTTATTNPPCNCSSNCNSSDAYYSVTLNNVSMNATELKSYLNNNSFGTSQCSTTSDCKVLDFKVAECSGETLNCTLIVKLQTNLTDVCSFKFNIEAINISDVTRVAMCSWSNNDPIGQNISWMESSASFVEFCSDNDLKSLVNCSSVVFLLKDRCYANQTIRNITTTPPSTTATTEPPCNCSSNCGSSEAYYSVTLNNVSMNAMELKSYLNQLFDATCTKTSDCTVLLDFVNMYKDFKVAGCSGETLQGCTVIVRLQTNLTGVCSFKSAIEAIIKQQNASINISNVTRVAMCSWSKDDPIGQNIILMESSASFVEFCSNNTLKSLVNCSSVAFLLNDRCDANQTFPNSTATPPSTTESTNTSVINADGLLTMTANASSLNSSQVDLIISQLEKLLSGPNVSMGLANTSVGIVNNLLDVPADVMVNFSKRANGIVDTVGLKLVVSGESEKLVTSSLALAVKKVNGANFEETSFSITDSSNLQIRSDSSLNRDVGAQDRSTSLGSITLPASLTQNLSPQDQQLASRVQFNFYQKDTFFQDKGLKGLNRTLISGILSTSVGNLSISNLQKNVTLTLHNTQDLNLTKDNYVVSCVFWDLGLNGGAGGWKSDGCHIVNSSGLETQCSCNHLTSFGILLDISKTPIDPLQNTILTYITYIGCGISAIFLSITLLTYLAFEKLRKDIPSKILIHLCFALLLLNLVFLIDPWLAQYQDVNGLCISTAFFLHYFLLASFTWMAMEAVHMYLAIVKVFNTYVSRFMLKIGFAGWGIPLIVVIIVIATNNVGNNYGLVSYAKFVDGTTDYFCWIINDIVFYVAVVAYFGIVFLLNFTMFIVVLVQLCRIKRQNPQNVQNRSSWQELRSVAGLTVLLGLTWGFAFFAWGPVNLPFMYLFAIFNTFQGLFIFIFHCAMKENVRRQWRTYLCCGKLRLPEHSDWSQTQTQKIKKATKKRPSSAQSNNSSSSFLNNDSVADAHMGIGNPYDDTIITSEEHHSDVVLNEISNHNLRKRSY